MLYKYTDLRYLAILTMIGNRIYDIANLCFLDSNNKEIVVYDNITNYYDEESAGIEYFTKEEEPMLDDDAVLISTDDESPIYRFENDYITEEKKEDLTSYFIKEARQAKLVLDPKSKLN